MMAPELDAAINYADHKVKELYDQNQTRRHARALIAKLLEGMDRQEGFNGFWHDGYRAALDDLQKISGTGSHS
jgi:hypothetical protein